MHHAGFFPGKPDKQAVLDMMVKEDAMVIRAKQLGLEKDPDVQRRYRNILVSALRQKEIGKEMANVQLTDEELQAYYRKNIQQFTVPLRIHLAEIMIPVEPGISGKKLADLKKKMMQCRKKALAEKGSDRSFGELAAEYSEDAFSRSRGGDRGWLQKGQIYPRLEPAVLSAGFALTKPGQISDVISTEKGLYLLKLMDRLPEKVLPYPNVEARIRQEIMTQKRAALEKQFYGEVLKSVKVETFPKVLDSINLPESPEGSQMFRSMPGGMFHQ